MNLTELKNSLAQFSNTVKLHPNFLFRGQADKSWELEPSFTRLVKKKKLNRNKALQLERESVNLFSITDSSHLMEEDLILWDGFQLCSIFQHLQDN